MSRHHTSLSEKSSRRALRLALAAVGVSLPVIGLMTDRAYGDLANGYVDQNVGGSWLGTPIYQSLSNPNLVATGQGPPTLAGTATFNLLSETITPTATFTLGRIDIIASGGGGGSMQLHIFPLNSTSPASNANGSGTFFSSSGSTSYAPATDSPGDLLGNGNGEAFNFYGFSNTDDVSFNLTDGPNANDEVTLNAGTTYALEFWEPSGTTLYWWRYTGVSDPTGGQAFSSPDATTSHSRQTLAANGEAGASRTFALALYQPNVWSQTSGGDWNTGSNWLSTISPTGTGMEADFFNAITAPSVVTSTQNDSVGILHFNSPNEYTLANGGGGSLTMQAVGGTSAFIQVDQSSAEIDVPTNLGSNTNLKVATGSTLTFGSPILLGSNTLVQTSGTSVLTGISDGSGGTSGIGGIRVTGGTLKLASNSGPNSVGTLTVSAGALDIANNPLEVNYLLAAGTNPVTDPVATIASYLAAGYAHGWTPTAGTIGSSSVAAANASQSRLIYSIGYVDGADGVTGLSSGIIEILPTLAGDAKLQGNVNFGDFQLLAANFGSSAGWDGGNFTYGSLVNFGDFQILAQNFGATASLTTGELASLDSFASGFGETFVPDADGGYSLAVVPEPASVGLLIAGAAGLAARRRKEKT